MQQTTTSDRAISFDPAWPSDCIEQTELAAGESVYWKPVLQRPQQSFDNLEEALELAIHPDIKAFYTTYWSENLAARAAQGECELLQAWNVDDFASLQENLIGHVLMKRRLGQQITFFIGLTDADDFILSIVNETGEVVLEPVGSEPSKVLARNLADYLDQLTVGKIS